jgi:RecA/RadA recombinase
MADIKNALLAKFKQNSTIKESSILSNSKFFKEKKYIDTGIPALNVALSGRLDGGMSSGLTMWAAPSRHFKTAFTLVMTRAYLDHFKDSISLFYDSEFGTPESYFDAFGIDKERVLHTPITNIEELKFDIMKQLEAIQRGEKVIGVIDSVGNLASKKEVEDALEGNSAADMTRAKQLKSLWRMVTPHLTLKDIPLIVVNHVYDEQKLHGRQIMGGGQGGMLSSDNVFFVSRSQEKDGDELIGYNFNIIVEKSRSVKERSRIPITVTFDGGISKWSGLLDMALESKHVVKPKMGWYSRVINGVTEEKLYRMKNTFSEEFWGDILKEESFKEWVKDTYSISQVDMLSVDRDTDEEEETED